MSTTTFQAGFYAFRPLTRSNNWIGGTWAYCAISVCLEVVNPRFGKAMTIVYLSGAVDTAKKVMSRVSAGMCSEKISALISRDPIGFGEWNDSKFGQGNRTGLNGCRFWTRPRHVLGALAVQQDTTWLS